MHEELRYIPLLQDFSRIILSGVKQSQKKSILVINHVGKAFSARFLVKMKGVKTAFKRLTGQIFC